MPEAETYGVINERSNSFRKQVTMFAPEAFIL